MYAIVEISGKQFRVSKEQNVKVPRLEGDNGSKVKFEKVLFYSDDSGKNQIGKPEINDMAVSATIVEHGRDKKIIVFKKKRRKGYQVKNGHRQGYSVIKIDDIGTVKKTAKPAAKEEATVKAAPKAKVEPKARPKPIAKKAAKPKAALAKKAVAEKAKTTIKKASEKKPAAKSKTAKPKLAEKKEA